MRKNILLPACLLMILLSTNVTAQVQLDWTRTYAGSGNQLSQRMAADNSGNVWVTGTVGANTTQDIYIMKYTAAGVQTGPVIFNSGANLMDRLGDITTDASGNVYVAGTSSTGSTSDIFILKYSSAGALLWSTMFSTPGLTLSIDQATAIAVDPSGNIYIGGDVVKNTGFEYDFLTVKYSASGVYQWHQLYNGPGNNIDMITDIAVDASGNAYVTGGSVGAGTDGYDYATIKYNTAGVQQWVARYTGLVANSSDQPTALAIDAAGNVYVTGSTMVISSNNSNCATVKYNNAGVQQWVAVFQGPAGKNDRSEDVCVDGAGNVYMGGSVTNTAGDVDMLVIKYNAAGVQQWWAPYDTGTGYLDYVTKAGMDGAGNFYVTGRSSSPATSAEIVTIKYTSGGTRAWVARYGAATAGAEYPDDMVVYTPRSLPGVIKNAFIYVTGATNSDAVTLKYSQPSVVGGGMAVAAASAKNATSTFSIDNTPNPFTAATIITYQLPEAGKVSLSVFDAMGRKVSTLVEATRLAGVYRQRFDRGQLSDGVYYCQYIVESNGQQFAKTQALVLKK